MRKVLYTDFNDQTKKLMLYQAKDGVYVFGYDCLQDTGGNWDCYFETIEDADKFCVEEYDIDKENWITISEPMEYCQHDIIMPTMVKGRDVGKPEFGCLQSLISNQWVDYRKLSKCLSFGGMTCNERLFTSGLMLEFDDAMLNDKVKVVKILNALKLDKSSIEKIIG